MYFQDLRYVRRRVDELQEGIDWINTEETLFKLNQSQFADIDEINLHLEPYTRLFKTTRQWQRAERKYMDGDFDLDAEKIDVETEGYYAYGQNLLIHMYIICTYINIFCMFFFFCTENLSIFKPCSKVESKRRKSSKRRRNTSRFRFCMMKIIYRKFHPHLKSVI